MKKSIINQKKEVNLFFKNLDNFFLIYLKYKKLKNNDFKTKHYISTLLLDILQKNLTKEEINKKLIEENLKEFCI